MYDLSIYCFDVLKKCLQFILFVWLRATFNLIEQENGAENKYIDKEISKHPWCRQTIQDLYS